MQLKRRVSGQGFNKKPAKQVSASLDVPLHHPIITLWFPWISNKVAKIFHGETICTVEVSLPKLLFTIYFLKSNFSEQEERSNYTLTLNCSII